MTGFAYDAFVLAGRAWRLTRTGPALVAMLVTPLVFLVGFLVVYARLLTGYGVNAAQYLPPAVVVQAMMLTAIATASAVGEDRTSGILARLRTLPLRATAVPVARLSIEGVRALVSSAVVVAAGYVAGFRLHGVLDGAGFLALAVGFALALCFGTATLALVVAQPESVYPLLYLPYLPLLTLSTAFAPADAFPDWLAPVVRVSPVSAVADALRALAAGHAPAGTVGAAVAWIAGLGLVLGFTASRAFRRVAP
ncbi:MAG TPA: ABC transporter permease [Rugosimonospora sp.]|nr:ABC transporter permease [Rugosimonospora sp.]